MTRAQQLSLTTDQFLQASKLLGDFWTLRILDTLAQGDHGFCELERVLGDSNPATLTSRLRRLEQAGIIGRRRVCAEKSSVCYELTDEGRSAIPVVEALKEYARATPRQKA